MRFHRFGYNLRGLQMTLECAPEVLEKVIASPAKRVQQFPRGSVREIIPDSPVKFLSDWLAEHDARPIFQERVK